MKQLNEIGNFVHHVSILIVDTSQLIDIFNIASAHVNGIYIQISL